MFDAQPMSRPMIPPMEQAGSRPLVQVLHARPEGFVAVLTALAGLAIVTLIAAAIFPHRPEELQQVASAVPAE